MHAIEIPEYGDASVLRWVERDEPTPGPGEVTIRLTMTGINFADVMARTGRYHSGSKPPFVPGIDAVGTIEAVGDGVHDLRPGRRVAAFPDGGTYAEVVRARPVLVYPLDDRISDDAGAALLLLVTAYNALTLAANLQRGESVLIHSGAGGVGSTAIQIARHLGAGRIFATAGGEAKVAIAREAGADVGIDYSSADVAAEIMRETDGRGVDVVLDAVAGDVFANSITALAPFGRYCIYGMASGKPGEVKTNALHPLNRAVVGYSTGHYRANRPEALRPAAEETLRLVAEGLVKPLVGARFALRDASKAQEHVESRASHGKVLLDPHA